MIPGGNVRVRALPPGLSPQGLSPEKSSRAKEAQEQYYLQRSRAALKQASKATVAGRLPFDHGDFMDTPSPRVAPHRRSAWPSPPEMRGSPSPIGNGAGIAPTLDVDAILEHHDREMSTSPRGGEAAAAAILAERRSPLDVGAILEHHDHVRRTSPKAGEGAAAAILAERRSSPRAAQREAAADAAMADWDGSTPKGSSGGGARAAAGLHRRDDIAAVGRNLLVHLLDGKMYG